MTQRRDRTWDYICELESQLRRLRHRRRAARHSTDQTFTVRRFKRDGCYAVIEGRRRGPIAPTPGLALRRWLNHSSFGRRSSREHPRR